MMMIIIHRLSAVILTCAVLLVSQMSEAAQAPPTTAAPQQAFVTEDSGTWRRDPFIGSTKKSGTTSTVKSIPLKTGTGLPKTELADIQLQGIMQTGDRYHALINGRSVKVGDSISGVTIKEISRFKVVVLNERKEKVTYDIYQGRIDRGKQ